MSETLEDVLAWHRCDDVESACLEGEGRGWGMVRRCDCGWVGYSDEHDRHQANAVRAWLLGQREAVSRGDPRDVASPPSLDTEESDSRKDADAVLAVLTGGDR